MKLRSWLPALAVLAASPPAAAQWSKFVAPDLSYSLHYPAGWQTRTTASTFEATRPPTNEKLLFVTLPYQATKSPKEHAVAMLAALRASTPDLTPQGFEIPAGSAQTTVLFAARHTERGKPYASQVMVLKTSGRAFWFSYSAPLSGYSMQRSMACLKGMVGSLTPGTDSQPPGIAIPVPSDRGARAAKP